MKPEFLDTAPAESVVYAHQNGWMQMAVYTHWFRHFMLHVYPSREHPVLLILDGHKTHFHYRCNKFSQREFCNNTMPTTSHKS